MPPYKKRTYRDGFDAGMETGYVRGYADGRKDGREFQQREIRAFERDYPNERSAMRKPKRKLSAWQKYIKNKRNHIKYRDGKLNLKKMGVAFRRKKRR